VLAGRPATLELAAEERELRRIAAFSNGDARIALNLLEAVVEGAKAAADDGLTITEDLIEATLQHKALLYDARRRRAFQCDLGAAQVAAQTAMLTPACTGWLGCWRPAKIRCTWRDAWCGSPRKISAGRSGGPDAGDGGARRTGIHRDSGGRAGAGAGRACTWRRRRNRMRSNTAYGAVLEDVRNTRADPVPLALRNAPTKLMKGMGYGRDYQYAHDLEAGVAAMECLPENLRGRRVLPADRAWGRKTISGTA